MAWQTGLDHDGLLDGLEYFECELRESGGGVTQAEKDALFKGYVLGWGVAKGLFLGVQATADGRWIISEETEHAQPKGRSGWIDSTRLTSLGDIAMAIDAQLDAREFWK